ncbi:MAG: RluA family pseudouridine synthase [Phycisphaerales bacterium]|nr:RluA family pseudouridine synthase [Phycisphaerales bacterium]
MSAESEDILERPVPIDDDSAERVTLHVRRKLPGRRLDKYLHGRFPRLSRTTIQRLIKQGAITVNGAPTKASYEMAGGDVVDLVMPAPEAREVIPEDIPLEIVYEDEHLIALNKQAGIICHPARAEQTGTLVNALAFYAHTLSHGEDPFRPGIVHRLDKNTTGIMLVAKTDEAHWRLALQFERRTTQKTYVAIVHGDPNLDSDTIDAPIGVHQVVREKFAVFLRENKIDITKDAVTTYEVLERFGTYTLMKLMPKTGRTHQLRVHMSHLGHPIIGDTLYGGRVVSAYDLSGGAEADRTPLFMHQALHAWRIAFRHPIEENPMELEAPFSAPLKRAVQLLRAGRPV